MRNECDRNFEIKENITISFASGSSSCTTVVTPKHKLIFCYLLAIHTTVKRNPLHLLTLIRGDTLLDNSGLNFV